MSFKKHLLGQFWAKSSMAPKNGVIVISKTPRKNAKNWRFVAEWLWHIPMI